MDTKTDKKWIELDLQDVLDLQEIMNSDVFRQYIASDPWLRSKFIPNLKYYVRQHRRISEKQWIRFCRIHEDAIKTHNQRKLIKELRKGN